MSAPTAGTYTLTIAGRAVTEDLRPFVEAFEYVDKVRGEADEITLSLDDTSGIWLRAWYPTKGDSLDASFGRTGRALMPAGTFTVDALDHEGPPSVLTLRALAASPNAQARTNTSSAHEAKTLRQIAEAIAAKHGYDLQGEVPALQLGRVTQHNATDLAFLGRLARDFGLVFSIRGRQMVWTTLAALEAQAPAFRISPKDVLTWRFSDALTRTYSAAEVLSHRPREGKAVGRVVRATEADMAGDTLRVTRRAENEQQAQALGAAALREANRKACQASFELPGTEEVLAGLVAAVEGWGRLSGRYLVDASRHRIEGDGGYTTTPECSLVVRT